jgi:hypothetical protein
MADWDSLKDEIFNMLQEETKDMWKKQDTEFLKRIAESMASEQIKSWTNPGEHIKNLQFLKAQLVGEIAIQSMNLNEKGNEVIGRLISIAIETIISIIRSKMK